MIQVGDIGTQIIITVTEAGAPLDVSAATGIELTFEKPSGAVLKRSASFVTNGKDGRIKYVIQTGELDTAGQWKVQARITFAADQVWHSEVTGFYVSPSLRWI